MGKTRDLFKKIGDTKGTFHTKIGTKKDKKGKNLTGTEEVARIQRGTIPKSPVNHNDVVTYLEPDILECKVTWALDSFTMNKAGGCDGIPAELFKILKDTVVKVLHSLYQ